MSTKVSFPIICTDHWVASINFYEDHLEYVPVFEQDGYAVLKREYAGTEMYLGLLESSHEVLPQAYQGTVNGMILHYPVDSVDLFYQQLYWEGLEFASEPKQSFTGCKHFFVTDPNGILINVSQGMEKENEDVLGCSEEVLPVLSIAMV